MSAKPGHDLLVARIPELLARITGLGDGKLEADYEHASGADVVLRSQSHVFVVELKKSTSAAAIAAAAPQVREYARRVSRSAVPIVVVPYMGDAGRKACEQADVGWIDLSGNAHITARGLRVLIEGRPNQFRARGRPSNVFAPMSSRVARWLLSHPGESFTQREIARATSMDEGFVSRIVSRLEREGYVLRDDRSAIRAKDGRLLLDAWREAYRFSAHTILRGTVAARSGDALLVAVSQALAKQKLAYAATGLGAAWLMTHFAAFRTASIYLEKEPSAKLREAIGFHEDDRGANLWLIVPNDEGVFHGAAVIDGVRCVHPVQVYLDLAEHPERATEAAERLRAEVIERKRDA
jgi:hypothetical protein